MPSPTEITVAQLSRLVGLPNAPALVDVRIDDIAGAGEAARHTVLGLSHWNASLVYWLPRPE